jgi:SlyX protein
MIMQQYEKRLEILESKLAFQELTIEILNQTLVKHEVDAIKMRHQIRALTERLKTASFSCVASASEETPPPHY